MNTPMTDALLLEINEGRVYKDHGPMVEHARQLERELAERTEELAAIYRLYKDAVAQSKEKS